MAGLDKHTSINLALRPSLMNEPTTAKLLHYEDKRKVMTLNSRVVHLSILKGPAQIIDGVSTPSISYAKNALMDLQVEVK